MSVAMAHDRSAHRRRTLVAALTAALILPFVMFTGASASGLPETVEVVVPFPTTVGVVEVVVVHGIPGVDVDVLIDGTAVVSDMSFTDSEVLAPAQGVVDIALVDPGTTNVVAGLEVAGQQLFNGTSYTVAAHLDADGDPTLTVVENDTLLFGVEVFHLAEFVDVDILVDGDVVAGGPLANGDSLKLFSESSLYEDVGFALAGETQPAVVHGDITVPPDSTVLLYAVGPDDTQIPTEPGEPVLPYTDIADSIHLDGIVALDDAGVIGGFGDGTFGPDEPINRAQMATFLADALELEPDADDPTFDDIAGGTHEANIRAVAAAGVTLGVGDGRYDPASVVPRGQMATFLVNAFELPTNDDAPSFGDIVGTTHERSIGAIADSRITGGIGDGDFGPNRDVMRGQMATFVARALGLIELAPEG